MMMLYNAVLTFFPLFQDGSLNWSSATTLPTLSWDRKSIQVIPVCTDYKLFCGIIGDYDKLVHPHY